MGQSCFCVPRSDSFKPKFRSSCLYRMVTRASLITTVIKDISQEMGHRAQLLPTYRTTGQTQESLFPVHSCFCLAISPVFTEASETPAQTMGGKAPVPPQLITNCWAHTCCLPLCSLLRLFPPWFSDTSLEFSCPSETTSNSHLRKEAGREAQPE